MLGLAASMPALATPAPQARLVHCGAETCLRLSGHRPQPTVAIRVAGRDLAVEGGRVWQVTVPLATARDWVRQSGDSLVMTLTDTRSGTESKSLVALPPGALGHRLELASLMISAH